MAKFNTYEDKYSKTTLTPFSHIFKHTKFKEGMQHSAMEAKNMKKKFHAQETYPRMEVHVRNFPHHSKAHEPYNQEVRKVSMQREEKGRRTMKKNAHQKP